MAILKNALIVSTWTLMSRFAGFARDLVIANRLGTSAASDAFFIALILPNLLRRLFAEGAFNVAFVPMLARIHEEQGEAAATRFSSAIFSLLLLVLLLITLLGEIFMPYIIGYVVAPGMRHNTETFELTVLLSRITFPYLLCISVASLFGSICNTAGRFSAFAAVPILFNVAIISTLIFMPYAHISPAMAGALGLPLAGLLQVAFMWHFLKKSPLKIERRWEPRHEEIKPFLLRLGPAALSVGVLQVSFLIDMSLASFLGENAISYLNYANRFYQLPLSLIGIAMATVLLPHFSRALKSKDAALADVTFSQTVIFGFTMGLACAVGLFFVAIDLMTTLFAHGAFTEESARQSAYALMAYICGLPAFIISKVTLTAFYANEDTRTPLIISCISLVISVTCSLILMQYFAHVGLAMATAIAGWCNLALQLLWIKRHGFIRFSDPRADFISALKALAVTAVMAVALVGYQHVTPHGAGTLVGLVQLMGAVIVGGSIFVAGVFFTKLIPLDMVTRAVFAKLGRKVRQTATDTMHLK